MWPTSRKSSLWLIENSSRQVKRSNDFLCHTFFNSGINSSTQTQRLLRLSWLGPIAPNDEFLSFGECISRQVQSKQNWKIRQIKCCIIGKLNFCVCMSSRNFNIEGPNPGKLSIGDLPKDIGLFIPHHCFLLRQYVLVKRKVGIYPAACAWPTAIFRLGRPHGLCGTVQCKRRD